MASVSEKLQKLINQIEDVAQDEFETLTEAIQALKDGQLGKEFEIWNVDDLIEFTGYVNNGVPEEGIKPMTHLNAKLMNDIGNSENLIDWTNLGIGTKEKPYQGTFDGQGYNIWLKFHTDNTNGYQEGRYFGLFHSIKNAFIKNLTLKGEFTTECDYTPGNPNTTEQTGMWIGCLAVDAYISKIHKCFNEININLQNASDATKGLIVYGCAGLVTNCYGTHIYQCGNLGNITLTKVTKSSTNKKYLRGYGGGLIFRASSYESIGGKIEECFNKGFLSNIMFGGGIAAHMFGENALDNEIELINTAKIPLPLTIFGYPNTLQSTVDLNNLVIEHSNNIIIEKYKAPQDSNKYQFIFISTNDIESSGFITINGTTKNIKIIPVEKSIKTTLIKNCYNTGNYGTYIGNYNYSSGILGTTATETILLNPFYYITNCFDAGNAFFDKSSSKPYTGYSYAPFISNKRYYQMGLFKNCHTIYNLNYAELTDLNDTLDSTTNRKWYREKISSQYSALMEHPHFCDMLDSNVFICADKYPCFRWEYEEPKYLDSQFTNMECLYLENKYINNLIGNVHIDHYNLDANKIVFKNSVLGYYSIYDSIALNIYLVNSAFTDNSPIWLSNLEKIDMYLIKQEANDIVNIPLYAFDRCGNLKTIIIRNKDKVIDLPRIETLNNTVLEKIYVPGCLLEQYKNYSNWTTYADKIKSIEGHYNPYSDQPEFFESDLEDGETLEERLNVTGGFIL